MVQMVVERHKIIRLGRSGSEKAQVPYSGNGGPSYGYLGRGSVGFLPHCSSYLIHPNF